MDFNEWYNYEIIQYSKIVEYGVILTIVGILFWKMPKSKNKEKEKEKEETQMGKSLNELRITSAKHSYDIHNLQLENYELRNKLDKIYSNDLTENINYYKNILSMNDKIEYMQKLVLKTSDLNDKFDVFTNYVDSKIMNFHRQYR
jgi:hypothetical protein